MKVLVVGASGFIGRNLLLGVPRSWDVYGTCRNPVDFSRFLSRTGLTTFAPFNWTSETRRPWRKPSPPSRDLMHVCS